MKRFSALLLAGILFICSFGMIGCSQTENDTNVLRVCNCEDYIDESLLDEFEDEFGIKVEYSTFGTNENLYNELVINPNSYDLVVPSEYMIEKLAMEGRIQKLNKPGYVNQLSNYQTNVSPYIKGRLEQLTFTPTEGDDKGTLVSIYDYMVGYMWGTMGWVYNTKEVTEEEVSSWDGVFANQNLKKKITIKDAVRDSYIVGLAMVYGDELTNATTTEEISSILNRVEKKDIDKVGSKLKSLKPMLYGFEVDSGKNDIVLGNIYAYVAWSGDAAYAIDVAKQVVEDDDGQMIDDRLYRELSYKIPDEGSNIWFDGFVMPSASTNYDAAYKFLEFISRPENAYRNMNETGYTSMIANGDFELEVEEEDGTTNVITTNLFNAVAVDWFDESADLGPEDEKEIIDISYFYGAPNGQYQVTVSKEEYGRFISQFPTLEIVNRCAIMKNFDAKTLEEINHMWESVKYETFPIGVIIAFFVLVVVIALIVVLYNNRDKIKWLKLPEQDKTAMEMKGYKAIKKESV